VSMPIVRLSGAVHATGEQLEEIALVANRRQNKGLSFSAVQLTAGGYKTLSAAFGVAYEPYRCLSCP
jgi:hypothetical protein